MVVSTRPIKVAVVFSKFNITINLMHPEHRNFGVGM